MRLDDGRLGRRIQICLPGEAPGEGYERCEIGTQIILDAERLVRFRLGKYERVIDDALLLCAGVEYCDRRQLRPEKGWGRVLHLRLPVYELARWEEPDVQAALQAAVHRLTGDEWKFEFRSRPVAAHSDVQTNIEMPQPDSLIVPFSRGMDSWAISRLLAKQRPVLVHLGSKPTNRKQKLNRNRPMPFEEIPFSIKSTGLDERSGRGRGFKFAMVSGLAAYLSGARTVVVPESGQGALGPVLLAHRYGDYRSHPIFLSKMEVLLAALLRHQIHYTFPRLEFTKGETLREAVALSHDASWAATRSCWQKSRNIGLGNGEALRQCGFCAACMLRRLSVHAAGLEEASHVYACEDLSAPSLEAGMAKGFKCERLQGKGHAYAVAGAMHLDHLAFLHRTDYEAHAIARAVRALARALGREEANVGREVRRMLNQHDIEWRAFVSSLAPRSFVRQWCAPL